MNPISEILVPIAICCVLPIVAILADVRKKMNETNQRTQIMLAAIEKNPEIDIEELMKKISRKPKLLKEKLLTKLLWGCLTTLLGICLMGFGIYLNESHLGGTDDPLTAVCFGAVSFVVGITFLFTYYTGKKMLAKEIEAEEKSVTEHV
jgi:hypothetical protein